ncbi:MAG: hypothetical protein LBF86_01960 [Helicobacteraceae bacterium]|jgi:hypothetical protein|nr:hypothetical protein [Helicobacteraceae bacterium]
MENKRLSAEQIAELDREVAEKLKFLTLDAIKAEIKPTIATVGRLIAADDFELPKTTCDNFKNCDCCQ